MADPSPLAPVQESTDAMMLPWGEGRSIVGQYDVTEVEYAAIRKAVALMDGAHRGLIRLTGSDRLDFLHRLLTQDCRSMRPGDLRRSFLLNSKGRVMADLLLVETDEATLLDLDIHQSSSVAEELDRLLFGENVRIEDVSGIYHRVSLHGPRAPDVRQWWADAAPAEAVVFRYDEVGETGVHIWAPPQTHSRFAEKVEALDEVFGLKFTGWLAWNIARVEAGHAMFNIDFGVDSLPHEAGPAALRQAVNFAKGCYRGQEIVARMESRGHPAKQLVGFRVEGHALPVAGVPILDTESAQSEVVGAVTSSTMSPMLGNVPIGLAMVKWGRHEADTTLFAPAEGRNVPVKICPVPFYGKVQG